MNDLEDTVGSCGNGSIELSASPRAYDMKIKKFQPSCNAQCIDDLRKTIQKTRGVRLTLRPTLAIKFSNPVILLSLQSYAYDDQRLSTCVDIDIIEFSSLVRDPKPKTAALARPPSRTRNRE